MNKREARKLALSVAISILKSAADTGSATEMLIDEDIEEKPIFEG